MGEYHTSLNTFEQQKLFKEWMITGDIDYKARIAISYTDFIRSTINKLTQKNYYEVLDVDDITQDIVVIVYNAIDNYDNQKASIYTYIHRIIYTKIIDKLRFCNVRTKRRSYVELDLVGDVSSENEQNTHNIDNIDKIDDTIYPIDKCGYKHLYDKDLKSRIYNTMHDILTKQEGALINMRYMDNFNITQIMKILKINRKKYGELEVSAFTKLKNNEVIKELRS